MAPELIRNQFGISQFVNADTIARGLSAFDVESVALEAGRIMLRQMNRLVERQASFAFETTLATRSFGKWIRERIHESYHVHLVFLWLPSAEMAIARVHNRVAAGGHDVPAEVIRRRYKRGLINLNTLYLPLVTSWSIYDVTQVTGPVPIAYGTAGEIEVENQRIWNEIKRR